jgi:hypothetical protein
MVKINGIKERRNMTKYVKIRDCVVGKKYRFEEHEHTVVDYEYNYSYMTGTCVTNKPGPNIVFGKKEQLIEIKLDFPRKELEGEFDNKLMFYFPHDEAMYDKVKVVEYK